MLRELTRSSILFPWSPRRPARSLSSSRYVYPVHVLQIAVMTRTLTSVYSQIARQLPSSATAALWKTSGLFCEARSALPTCQKHHLMKLLWAQRPTGTALISKYPCRRIPNASPRRGQARYFQEFPAPIPSGVLTILRVEGGSTPFPHGSKCRSLQRLGPTGGRRRVVGGCSPVEAAPLWITTSHRGR